MIFDVEGLPGRDAAYDVIIVGAGINGTVLASQLDGGSSSILLLEAGDDGPGEPWVAQTDGLAFEGAKAGRRRGFGGSGAWWAGQCAPFSPMDLETRDWVPDSGWPISWPELEAWYAPAAQVLGIEGESFGDDQWRRRRVEPVVAPGAGALGHKFSAFLPDPDVAQRLRAQLAASQQVTVATGAQVSRLHRHGFSDRIGGVLIAQPGGLPDRLVTAPVVVLAAGGIETPRILLQTAEEDGFGNGDDLAGRYLQDHPSGIAARVVPADQTRMLDLYGMLYAPRSRSRTRNWARIPLAAGLQREHRTVAATSNVVFDDEAGALDGLKQLVRQLRGTAPLEQRRGRSELVRQALAGLPLVPGVAWRRFGRGLSPAHASASVWLRTAAEQPPRRESRVRLSADVDEFGLRTPLIEWQLGEHERTAQRLLVEQIAHAWGSAGLATVEPLSWLTDEHDDWREHQVDAYHHCGTTRMSAAARQGVVDRDLQSHELPGLYVTGSSVFPTSSDSNPTFTSVALTLRLASHLRHRERVPSSA